MRNGLIGALAGLLVVIVAAAATWGVLRSRDSEVLVADGLALGPGWQEISPGEGLRTTEVWSELLVEVPNGPSAEPGKSSGVADDDRVHIEAFLTTDDGANVDLDQAGLATYSGVRFVCLSSRLLQWKGRDYRFRSVTLRAARPLTTGKVIWMSYDPRSTKSGVQFPRALSE